MIGSYAGWSLVAYLRIVKSRNVQDRKKEVKTYIIWLVLFVTCSFKYFELSGCAAEIVSSLGKWCVTHILVIKWVPFAVWGRKVFGVHFNLCMPVLSKFVLYPPDEKHWQTKAIHLCPSTLQELQTCIQAEHSPPSSSSGLELKWNEKTTLFSGNVVNKHRPPRKQNSKAKSLRY